MIKTTMLTLLVFQTGWCRCRSLAIAACRADASSVAGEGGGSRWSWELLGPPHSAPGLGLAPIHSSTEVALVVLRLATRFAQWRHLTFAPQISWHSFFRVAQVTRPIRVQAAVDAVAVVVDNLEGLSSCAGIPWSILPATAASSTSGTDNCRQYRDWVRRAVNMEWGTAWAKS